MKAMSLASIGAVVAGDAELEQALITIVTTNRGEVPGLPEFGIEMSKMIDRPIADVRRDANLTVQQGVQASDPRITILAVIASAGSAPGKVRIEMRWRPTNGTAVRSSSVEVGRAA